MHVAEIVASAHWGDIPGWVSAVGTGAATGFAGFVAWRESKRAAKAEGERDALRREQIRDQASKVVAWTTRSEDQRGNVRFAQVIWRVTAKNVSTEPVFAVKAEIVHGDGYHHVVLEEWDVLPPLDEVHHEVTNEINGYDKRPYVRLTFTDAAGRRWQRGEGGRLTEVSADESAGS